MQALDLVIARGEVDTTRMAVLGGSYGGFMTNWILGKTQRFAVAQTDRSIYDNAGTPYVNLGIAAAAHGTHVAGITAAHKLFDGKMAGAAPGAKLMAIKACLSTPSCTSSQRPSSSPSSCSRPTSGVSASADVTSSRLRTPLARSA